MSLHQPDLFPETLYLKRIDPSANMRRYYRLRIDRDLFGQWGLVREWGRIGCKGRVMREEHPGVGEALDALDKHANRKRKRGYKGV